MTDRDIELFIDGTSKDSATVDSRPGGEATATLQWDTTDDGTGQFTARVVLDDEIDADLETVKVPATFDGTVIAGVREDAKALDPADGAELWSTADPTPDVQAGIKEMRIGPDEAVAYAGADSQLIALDAGSGSVNWRYEGHGSAVQGITIPNDGGAIYTASRAGEVTAIDPTGTEQWVYNGAFSSDASISDVAVTSDGSTVFASSDDDNKVVAIDTASQSANWEKTDFSNDVSCVGISPDGQAVYAGSETGEILRALAASDGAEQWVFGGYPQYYGPTELVVAPDGDIHSGNGNGDIVTVGASGNELWSQTIGIGTIQGVSVSPDSATIYSASSDFGDGQLAATDAESGTTTVWSNSYSTTADSVSAVGEYHF